MKKYVELENIEICLSADEKECKKDFKKTFIENIQLKHFNIFKNPTVKTEVEEKEIGYFITAENGYFTIFEEVPLHMHIGYYLKNENEIEEISNLLTNLGNLCEKASKKEIKYMRFIITFKFSLLKKIKIENYIKIKEKNRLLEENDMKELLINGIEFFVIDSKKLGYEVRISNMQNELSIVIMGKLQSKKEKESLKLHEIYTLTKKKLESLLLFVDGGK